MRYSSSQEQTLCVVVVGFFSCLGASAGASARNPLSIAPVAGRLCMAHGGVNYTSILKYHATRYIYIYIHIYIYIYYTSHKPKY